MKEKTFEYKIPIEMHYQVADEKRLDKFNVDIETRLMLMPPANDIDGNPGDIVVCLDSGRDYGRSDELDNEWFFGLWELIEPMLDYDLDAISVKEKLIDYIQRIDAIEWNEGK